MKNNAEKIEAAAKKKEEGNAWFKMGKYVKASKRYEKVNKHFWSKSNRLKYVTISSW
jgi:FK506-binding protein 4/5